MIYSLVQPPGHFSYNSNNITNGLFAHSSCWCFKRDARCHSLRELVVGRLTEDPSGLPQAREAQSWGPAPGRFPVPPPTAQQRGAQQQSTQPGEGGQQATSLLLFSQSTTLIHQTLNQPNNFNSNNSNIVVYCHH